MAQALAERRFKLLARVSSADPTSIRPILERMLGKASINLTEDGFEIQAEMEGGS